MIQVFAPTAAIVSIRGRVSTINGNGIRNIIVTLTDTMENTSTTRIGTFGNYQFNEVVAGETYIISASSKRFSFNPASQILTADNELAGINFFAIE